MANLSKAVLTGNNSKHKSRLVVAGSALRNIADADMSPLGVWGSTAIIKSGGVTIKSSELDLEFQIPFDGDLEANEGEAIVYNLSDNTISQLKKDAKITIEAGYEGDTGVIFNGYITKVLTRRENSDKVTTIKIKDDVQEKKNVSHTFAAGTTAKYILKWLIERTNLSVGNFSVGKDYRYSNSITIDDSLESAIKQYSRICNAKTIISNGVIHCYSKDDMDDVRFNVSEETGMIGSPSPFEEKSSNDEAVEGFEIVMLLQHRMFANAVISLKSEMYKGTYTVVSGSHTFNESECITTIKVV